MRLDKDKIKESLTKEDINTILRDLGAKEPKYDSRGNLIFNTICHNGHGGSHKLYYYTDSHNFHCYTNCGNIDIYELVIKVKEEQGYTYNFYESVKYVADITNKHIGIRDYEEKSSDKVDDWEYLNRFKKHAKPKGELPSYDENVLDVFMPYLNNWIDEGITKDIAEKYEIGYYFKEEQIVIPNRSEDGRLIGIRSRNTDPEKIEAGMKYIPTRVGGNDYRFLSMYNLYGFYFTKEAIKRNKKCLIFEGEKSVLKAEKYYGEDNFTVAVYGSNISSWQRDKILEQNIEEVFIAFDKFREQKEGESDSQYERLLLEYKRRLVRLAHMFSPFVRTYIVYDEFDLLKPKDAPIDRSKETFEFLMKNKFEITTKEDLAI